MFTLNINVRIRTLNVGFFLGGGGGVMEVELREGMFALQYTNWTVRS